MLKLPMCGNCRHWYRQANKNDLANPDAKGECRQCPPAAIVVPLGNGLADQYAQYPLLPPSFPACAQFSERPSPA